MDVGCISDGQEQDTGAGGCELDRPHLDISTHDEAASVGKSQVSRLASAAFFQLT